MTKSLEWICSRKMLEVKEVYHKMLEVYGIALRGELLATRTNNKGSV